jgi:hypothetical protein
MLGLAQLRVLVPEPRPRTARLRSDTIAMYVVRCADQRFAVSLIRVHLAAIRTTHLLASLSVDPRHPRLATPRSPPATAPCCWWASGPRSELIALTIGDLKTVPAVFASWCGGPKPANRARTKRSPPGPVRPRPVSAHWPPSPAGWNAGARPPIWIGPPVRHPAPNGRCSVR